MSSISSIKTFTTEVLTSADLNSWFSEIRTKVNTYGAWLDASSQTFTGANTFSGAVTTSAGITVNTTGLTVAPQTAITFSHASARVVPGSTGLYFRNNANDADNVAITDAGAVTVRAGLTITASGLTVTAGGITVTSGDLTLSSGTLSIATLTVTGAASFEGNVTLGNATGDTVTFTGRIASDMDFTNDASNDIGGSVTSNRPRDVFVARDLVVGSNTVMTSGAMTGLFWLPTINGTPGSVSDIGTHSAMVYDYAADKIWVRNHNDDTWRSVALT